MKLSNDKNKLLGRSNQSAIRRNTQIPDRQKQRVTEQQRRQETLSWPTSVRPSLRLWSGGVFHRGHHQLTACGVGRWTMRSWVKGVSEVRPRVTDWRWDESWVEPSSSAAGATKNFGNFTSAWPGTFRAASLVTGVIPWCCFHPRCPRTERRRNNRRFQSMNVNVMSRRKHLPSFCSYDDSIHIEKVLDRQTAALHQQQPSSLLHNHCCRPVKPRPQSQSPPTSGSWIVIIGYFEDWSFTGF